MTKRELARREWIDETQKLQALLGVQVDSDAELMVGYDSHLAKRPIQQTRVASENVRTHIAIVLMARSGSR